MVLTFHSKSQSYRLQCDHFPGQLVSVPDLKQTPVWIAFSIARREVIYAPDEIWGQDYRTVGQRRVQIQ